MSLTAHEEALLRWYSVQWGGIPLPVLRDNAHEMKLIIERIGPTDNGYVPMVLRERAVLEFIALLEKSERVQLGEVCDASC